MITILAVKYIISSLLSHCYFSNLSLVPVDKAIYFPTVYYKGLLVSEHRMPYTHSNFALSSSASLM